MTLSAKVEGIESAQKAISEALKDIQIGSEELLTVILQGISLHTAPYVPIDTSFLINSEYRNPAKVTGNGTVTASIGYAAEYAVYVHEGPQKNWQRAGASNRFLELGARDYIADQLSYDVRRFTR